MTIKEAILILNANVVVACERAGFNSATVKMIEDALDTIEDALKMQEPRVMTLGELKLCTQETIWFEEKPNHIMKQLTQDGIAALVFVGILHNWNGFGTVWRCWITKPTDEQREATPWE